MTAEPPAPRIDPFFLDGPAGRLFAVRYAPAGAARGHLIFVPSFAEELNRSRRVVAEAARALSNVGVGTLVLDLFGTGNSAGAFAEARWELWQGDVMAAHAWLAAQDLPCLGLWGCRLGASLASALAAAQGASVFPHLLLWQPVTSGRTFVTQFLRIRTLAAMADDGKPQETTKTLRAALAAGETVEVAGYPLAEPLVAAIERLSLADHAPIGPAIDWIELVGEEGAALAPAKRRLADAWREAGAAVALGCVAGPSFWMIEENAPAPALIAETVECVAGWVS